MSRKWIGGPSPWPRSGRRRWRRICSAAGGSAPTRPGLRDRDVDLGQQAPAPRAASADAGGRSQKPKVVYLQSRAPLPINPADPAAGGVGPYIDVKLTGCSKVIDGGVVPSRTDVFVQGTYVKSPSEYHVLIGHRRGKPRRPRPVHGHLQPHLPQGHQVKPRPTDRRGYAAPVRGRGMTRRYR